MEFEGKSYLIVGASSGVGLSIAQKLVEKGAEVFTTSRDVNKDFPGKKIELNISDDLSNLSAKLPERLNGLVYCPGTINLKPFSFKYLINSSLSEISKTLYHSEKLVSFKWKI